MLFGLLNHSDNAVVEQSGADVVLRRQDYLPIKLFQHTVMMSQ